MTDKHFWIPSSYTDEFVHVNVRGHDVTLAFQRHGAVGSRVAFMLCHGMPGGSRQALPHFTIPGFRSQWLTYDRPGYGLSTVYSHLVRDAAEHVRPMVEASGVEALFVAGRSAGAASALAIAAGLPEVVKGVAVVASSVPVGTFSFDELQRAGIQRHNLAPMFGDLNEELTKLRAEAREAVANPRYLLEKFHIADASGTNSQVPLDAIQQMQFDMFRAALPPGSDGEAWPADMRALWREPWGVEFGEIRCPVRIWHGGKDTVAYYRNAEWLRAQIPHAHLEIDPEGVHSDTYQHTPRLVAEVIGDALAIDPLLGLAGRHRDGQLDTRLI